jgi:hypothetical protein
MEWVGLVGGVIGVVGGLLGGAAAFYAAVRFRAIEDYRAQLKAEGYEHEVRFARLHERRMEVIADLHDAIIEAERGFSDWTHPAHFAGQPPKEELGSIAATKGTDLSRQIRSSRIWLDEDLLRDVDRLDESFHRVFVRFTTFDLQVNRSEYLDAWREVWEEVSGDVPRIRESVERRFRAMLGVEARVGNG